jgi:hypothetical protein
MLSDSEKGTVFVLFFLFVFAWASWNWARENDLLEKIAQEGICIKAHPLENYFNSHGSSVRVEVD